MIDGFNRHIGSDLLPLQLHFKIVENRYFILEEFEHQKLVLRAAGDRDSRMSVQWGWVPVMWCCGGSIQES